MKCSGSEIIKTAYIPSILSGQAFHCLIEIFQSENHTFIVFCLFYSNENVIETKSNSRAYVESFIITFWHSIIHFSLKKNYLFKDNFNRRSMQYFFHLAKWNFDEEWFLSWLQTTLKRYISQSVISLFYIA